MSFVSFHSLCSKQLWLCWLKDRADSELGLIFFLKAKSEASKQDNPNWRDATNGPFNEEYWKAAVKELKALKKMDAWKIVDQTKA